MNEIYTDCNSETGITVGLIDAIISIVHVLYDRNMGEPEVLESLKDLIEDHKFQFLIALEDEFNK